MYRHHAVQQNFSQLDVFILAYLIHEPKTATAWYEAVSQATEQGIEPGAFSRIVARLQWRGWIEAGRTEYPWRLYQITASGLLAIERAEMHQQREPFLVGGHPNWEQGRESIMRLVLRILRLYPSAWRERYETEMIALLEQHHVTHRTVLDLCIGVLDARLDPRYRRVRPLIAGPHPSISWGLMMGAWVAFLFTSFFWLRVSSLGLPDHVGHWVETLAPVPYQLLALRTLLTYITLLPLCIAVPIWLVIQTFENNRWNALRFLPFLAALLLFPFLSWWQEEILGVMLMVALALESGGLLLTIAGRWMLRHQFVSALLAWVVTGGMVLMCIVNAVWTGKVWQLIPQVRPIDPHWQMGLVLQLVLMLLATVVALVGCVHGMLARRASDLPFPKQEPL